MKTRFLLVLTLLLTLTVVPAFAHEGHEEHSTDPTYIPAEHGGSVSFHEKFDKFLQSVPANNSYVVSLESKTANDILLDVRDAESFQKAPLKDAINIPLTDLHAHVKELPKDKNVFVVGSSTVDAAYALVVLRLHDVNAWLVKSHELPSGCPLEEKHNHQHPMK